MGSVTRKTELDVIDGTPEKRLFLSIISDYDLCTGLCELIDNALDLWVENEAKGKLHIEVTLDPARQLITVKDNAGGVGEGQLRLLIAPGATRNQSGAEIIGTFGVGGKRAGVALGELVEIRTRYKKEKSLQIDINKEWLASDDWHLAAYEIPDIDPGTTSVSISQLRQQLTEADVYRLRVHLAETYGWFIEQGCVILLNRVTIAPVAFDAWAYPPTFEPRRMSFQIAPTDKNLKINVTIEAGLILDRDPEEENYGVYFYCNKRLIVKELKVRDVGYFISSEAGVPHPDASLCRVIVRLQGPAEAMPWTSSKSGINFNHEAFLQLRPQLIGLVSYFSSLSRRFKKKWDEEVYPHTSGVVQDVDPNDIDLNRRIVLPDLPRSRRPAKIDELKTRNRKELDEKPWTLGLVETLGIIDLVTRQRFETKNRVALILLDSNFEIGLKEFIVNRPDLFPPAKYRNSSIANLFQQGRKAVVAEVQPHINLSAAVLGKIEHYYLLRNSLIHERATQQITDTQVSDYRRVVEKVLSQLFGLKL
jgi:hypothetical protein